MGILATTPTSEREPEDAPPEAREVVPIPARPGAKRERLHDDEEQREPHRELREQVVERDRERELEAVPRERVHAERYRV